MTGRIRAFNRKIDELGLDSGYKMEYKDVKGLERNAWRREYNRMGRLLQPGAGDIIEHNGVRYTVWERNEVNYALRRVNANRAKMREFYESTRGLQPTEDYYKPYTRTLSDVTAQRDVPKLLQSYLKMASEKAFEEKKEQFYENLYESIEWMKELPQYEKLDEYFRTAPLEDLIILVGDRYSPTNIYNNYKPPGMVDEDEIMNFADKLVDRWINGIKYLKKLRPKRKKK